MTYKAVITKSFEKDLEETLEYISDRLYNPTAAQKLLKNISEKITIIEENPLLYPLYHDDKLANMGYRSTAAANYLLFYRVDEDEKLIFFSRLLYGARNITNII